MHSHCASWVMASYSGKDGAPTPVYTLGPLEAQDHALLGEGARERRKCLELSVEGFVELSAFLL